MISCWMYEGLCPCQSMCLSLKIPMTNCFHQTVKHLFLSDGIPGKTKGPTCSPIAKIYKIRAITRYIIAYDACQV